MKQIKIIYLSLALVLLTASVAFGYDLRPEAYWGEAGLANVLESVFVWAKQMALVGIIAVVYLFPTIIALLRSHNRLGSILALNFFLGLTVIGWIAALIWSLTGNVHSQNVLDRFGSTA